MSKRSGRPERGTSGWRPRSARIEERDHKHKTIRNRLHLDIDASGRISGKKPPAEERRQKIQATVKRLTALGAAVAGQPEDVGDWFVVMRDPEGNEFCVA